MKQKSHELFSLIKADHHKVDSLFAKLEKTTERASKTRTELYAELRHELTVHAQAEEKAFYPDLKACETTEDIGFESVEEHGLMKFLLQKLDKTSVESKEWSAQITALKEVVEHHVEEEEEQMFPKMKKAFSTEELDEFASRFKAVKGETKAPNKIMKKMASVVSEIAA